MQMGFNSEAYLNLNRSIIQIKKVNQSLYKSKKSKK
jgi:hypothetical protein